MASGTGIGEFFVSIAIDSAQGSLNVSDLTSRFGQLELATVAEIGALWALAVGLAGLVDGGMKSALALEQLTMHTGMSAQELQKWQRVAMQSHASAEDVSSSVEALTKHLANLAVGIPDGALGSLQQLGITAQKSSGEIKTAGEIMEEVRHRLGVVSKDPGQQERILAGLGINANLREELLLNDKLFDSRASIAHGMTGDQEKKLDALRQQFVQIELVAKDIAIDIAAFASPTLKGFFSVELAALKEIRAWMETKQTPATDPRGWRMKQVDQEQADFMRKLFNPNPKDLTGRQQLEEMFPRFFGGGPVTPGLDLTDRPGGREGVAPTAVHNTYHIHDAHDPHKILETMDRHWDEMLQRKTLDGADQQTNNGGY